MTTIDNPTPPAPEPVDDVTVDPPEPEAKPDDKPGREAARYRRQLRDAEAERDRLAAALADRQHQDVTDIAADHLLDPADFLLVHTDLSDFLDDDGNVDEAKVAEAVEQMRETRPHWFKPTERPGAPASKPREALRGGSDPTGTSTPTSWGDLLRGGSAA